MEEVKIKKDCKNCIYYDGGNGCYHKYLRDDTGLGSICIWHGYPYWKLNSEIK